MRKRMGWIPLGLALGVWACVSLAGETNAVPEQAVNTLKTENRLLREENQKLREELVQGDGVRATNAVLRAADAASASATNGAVLYWISSGSNKRHNPSCRYYMKSEGYQTPKKEGVPCKICGG